MVAHPARRRVHSMVVVRLPRGHAEASRVALRTLWSAIRRREALAGIESDASRVPKLANQPQQRQSCRLLIWTGCMAARRFVKPLLLVVIPAAAIAALVAFWNWDWLIPIVQA